MMVVDVGNTNSQFQVGYMSNPILNVNREFKELVRRNLQITFDSITMFPVSKVLRKDTTCVLSLIMFYENRKIMFLKVFGWFFYCILYNHIVLNHLCLQQT